MQFPDLTQISERDVPGYQVESSGKTVQERVTKSQKEALEQQQNELADAIEKLALCSPSGDPRRFKILETKCTQTNSLGKLSYYKGVASLVADSKIVSVIRHDTELKETHIVSTVGRKVLQEEVHVTKTIPLGKKSVEISALLGAGKEEKKVIESLGKLIYLFNKEKITSTGVWNALNAALSGTSAANISLKIDNVLFVAHSGDSRTLLVDDSSKATMQMTVDHEDAQPKINIFELQPGRTYTLVQASGIFDTMTSDHVGYFMSERPEDLGTKTEFLATAAIEDFEAARNITIISRSLKGK